MLLARALRKAIRPAVRFYGWETPEDKTGNLFYQHAESLNTSDKATPEQLGYTVDAYNKDLNKQWQQSSRITAVNDHNQGGTTTELIVDSEVNDNPLGQYDNHERFLPEQEVKTRVIHVLRHFEKVNLKQLDWNAHLEDGLKLDSLDRVALLTSIETEFNTVFEDNVFDHINTLNQVVLQLTTDRFVI